MVKKTASPPPDSVVCELCGKSTPRQITITYGDGYKSVCPKCYHESK